MKQSIIEEFLSVAFLIAALYAWNTGWHILACFLFGKAALDTIAAWVKAAQEVKQERAAKAKGTK